MRRIIRTGPRPLIAAAIMLALLLTLPLYILITKGPSVDDAKLAASFIVIIGLFCLVVRRSRVTVTADSIEYQRGFGPVRRMYFRDIAASVPIVAAEPDWPITLAIYRDGSKWPAMFVPLKPWHRSDVTWLLRIPELKVQPPSRGLTKRSSQPLTGEKIHE